MTGANRVAVTAACAGRRDGGPAGSDLAGVEESIRQALFRYCRGVDRCDRELTASCFVPGAPVDYVGILQGTIESFIDFVMASHATLRAHSHVIGNVLIDTTGSDVTSEAYGHIVLWKPAGEGVNEVVVRNRYLDRWTNVDGRWLIAERLQVIDQRTVDGRPDLALLDSRPGRHNTSDLSYDFLASRPIAAASHH